MGRSEEENGCPSECSETRAQIDANARLKRAHAVGELLNGAVPADFLPRHVTPAGRPAQHHPALESTALGRMEDGLFVHTCALGTTAELTLMTPRVVALQRWPDVEYSSARCVRHSKGRSMPPPGRKVRVET